MKSSWEYRFLRKNAVLSQLVCLALFKIRGKIRIFFYEFLGSNQIVFPAGIEKLDYAGKAGKVAGNDVAVVDIFFNEKVYLRVNSFKNKVRPSIRISKTTKSLDMSKIYTYVKNSNSYIDENDKWVNIFKDPIPMDEYHVWFQDITSNLGIFQNGN